MGADVADAVRGESLFEAPEHWPFTSSFVLANASLARVSTAIASRSRGRVVSVEHDATTSLKDAFDQVPYLSIRRDVALLVSTSFGWTACFDNGPLGPDATTTVGYLVRNLACPAVVIGYTPQITPVDGFSYAGAVFSYYEPAPMSLRRGLAAWQDGKKWYFESHGEPLTGERTEAYLSRRVARRLVPSQLAHLCSLVGVDSREAAFGGPALTIIRDTSNWLGPSTPNLPLSEFRTRARAAKAVS